VGLLSVVCWDAADLGHGGGGGGDVKARTWSRDLELERPRVGVTL
jgi:hypothetical protein